jgi:hypothetical protein
MVYRRYCSLFVTWLVCLLSACASARPPGPTRPQPFWDFLLYLKPYPEGTLHAQGATPGTALGEGVWLYYEKGGAIRALAVFEDHRLSAFVILLHKNGNVAAAGRLLIADIGMHLSFWPTGNWSFWYADGRPASGLEAVRGELE